MCIYVLYMYIYILNICTYICIIYIYICIYKYLYIWYIYILYVIYYNSMVQKSTLLCFSSQSCFTIFFPYFSGGVDSRPGRLFWHQYGSNWTLYYASGNKNHWGILYCKISSSDTVAMQERFWQEQCTWWKDNSMFGGQILEERKCGWYPQRATSFIVRHNSWEYSEFTGSSKFRIYMQLENS